MKQATRTLNVAEFEAASTFHGASEVPLFVIPESFRVSSLADYHDVSADDGRILMARFAGNVPPPPTGAHPMKALLTLIVGIALGAVGARMYAAPRVVEPEPQAAAALPDLPEPYYRVLYENEAVRVVNHLLEPGQSEPAHTHPPMVAYFVEGATAAITEADGSTAETTIPTGAFLENLVWWTHSLENVGDTPLHSILIEFKGRESEG